MSHPNALSFPTTDWSMIAHAAHGDDQGRHAVDEVLARYVPVMRAYLRAKWRLPADGADELLQGFLLAKVVEEGLLSKADRGRGRFRTFLATALDRYVISEYRRQTSAKRRTGHLLSLEQNPDLEHAAPVAADTFDLAWARQVLASALTRMKTDCEVAGRDDVWSVFEARVLAPLLEGKEPVPLGELMKRLDLSSPEQASNLGITAKRMFARGLRAAVNEFSAGEAATGGEGGTAAEDEEIRRLMQILSRRRA